jgi:hypothetical protein
MLFMVVEHFKPGSARKIYQAVRERGRQLPEGLTYVDSWVEAGFGRCFQLMECEDPVLLQEWVLQWDELDVGTFEIVPVVHSSQTRELVERYLPPLAAEEELP